MRVGHQKSFAVECSRGSKKVATSIELSASWFAHFLGFPLLQVKGTLNTLTVFGSFWVLVWRVISIVHWPLPPIGPELSNYRLLSNDLLALPLLAWLPNGWQSINWLPAFFVSYLTICPCCALYFYLPSRVAPIPSDHSTRLLIVAGNSFTGPVLLQITLLSSRNLPARNGIWFTGR